MHIPMIIGVLITGMIIDVCYVRVPVDVCNVLMYNVRMRVGVSCDSGVYVGYVLVSKIIMHVELSRLPSANVPKCPILDPEASSSPVIFSSEGCLHPENLSA
jgi:hypothetical protein